MATKSPPKSAKKTGSPPPTRSRNGAAPRKTPSKWAPGTDTPPALKPTEAPVDAVARTVTPYLAVDGAEKALAWYGKAFGAKVISRQPVPGGKLMHAAMQIGDSIVFVADIFDGSKYTASPVTLHVSQKDIDKVWNAAVGAGAKVTMPIANMFWGERYGQLADPFGHRWSLSYPVKMSEAEKKAGQEQAMRMFAASTPVARRKA